MEQVVQSANAVNPTRSLLGRQIFGLKSFPTRLGIVLMMFGNITLLSAFVAREILLGGPYKHHFVPTTLGQLGLLGLWVSFGSGATWMRVVAGALVCYMLTIAINIGMGEGMSAAWPMSVLAVASVAFPAFLLRWWMGVLVGEPGKEPLLQPTNRFGIRDLMVLTLLIAFLLAFAKWISPGLPRSEFWFYAATFGITNSVIALSACWATLSQKAPIARLALFSILVAGCWLFLPWALLQGPWYRPLWVIHTCTQTSVLVASLLLVRWSGFRLVKGVQTGT